MEKTKYDFMELFGITPNLKYHAYDYAIQVCNGCWEVYQNSEDNLKEMQFEIAKIIALKLNAPIPVQ